MRRFRRRKSSGQQSLPHRNPIGFAANDTLEKGGGVCAGSNLSSADPYEILIRDESVSSRFPKDASASLRLHGSSLACKGKTMKPTFLLATTCAAAMSLAATGALGADEPTPKAVDKSQYTLFNPTPRDQMRPFNTDRPTKSNVPYTVDAGHFQYEGDIFIYSFDNTTTPDTNNTSWVLFNPTFKAGLTNFADFEVNFSVQNIIRSQTVSTGAL